MKTPMPCSLLTHPELPRTIWASVGLVTLQKHLPVNPNPLGSGLRQSVWKAVGPTILRQTKPKARSPMGFFLAATRQGALANGADISRTQERQRCGKTYRSESALIERPTQAWLNVTHRSSHPEESIRQAHLVWEGQMNPPDGAGRETPVTRWSYA